jgi:hypothetical protein
MGNATKGLCEFNTSFFGMALQPHPDATRTGRWGKKLTENQAGARKKPGKKPD